MTTTKMRKYIVNLMQRIDYELDVEVYAENDAEAEKNAKSSFPYGIEAPFGVCGYAGPLDCGGIREVDVHGSKGPL
jgi:hypothetical protein